MDDYRRRRPKSNAVVYYVLLAALVLAVASQVAVPHSLAEPDARRRLAPLSAEDARGARSTPVAQLLTNNTNGKYTITAAEQRNADKQQGLALRSSKVETAADLAARAGTGLASRIQAQHLEDFELEDIVLLATVDGSLHACDRRTGREKWSLDFPDSPMIETINYERNRSSEDDAAFENDYIFIVEPSREGTGNLYMQNRDPSKGGLQKLQTTVQALAGKRPHDRIPGTPYSTIASQHSSTYTIDAASGSVLRRQDINSPFVNADRDRSCPLVDPFTEESQECEPVGIFVLGRMEYTIIISDADTSEDLCRIKFAEWTINSRNADLQAEHDATPLERRQILSFSDGQIMGMESADEYRGPKFRAKFDSPVTQVFDVARPVDTKGTSASLVILTQPVVLPQDSQSLNIYQGIPRDRTKVFVNKTRGGSYFLMSEEQYPFSTSTGSWSKLFQGIDTERTEIDLDSEEDDMTGVHRLVDSHFYLPLLDAPSSYQAVKELAPRQEGEMVKAPSNRALTPNWAFLLAWGLFGIFAIVAMFAVGLRMGNRLCLTIQAQIERWTGTRIEASAAKQAYSAVDNSGSKLSSSLSEDIRNQAAATSEDTATNASTPSAEKLDVLEAESTEKSKHIRHESQKSASDEESPEAENVENPEIVAADIADGEADPAPDDETRLGKKNRPLPRKRGGVKNKKKKPKTMDDASDTAAQVPEKEAISIAGPVQPVSLDGQAATPDPAFVPELQLESGKTQVGVITVDTRMGNRLGDGSNGTIVFRGEFGPRQVAVKRLIRSPRNFAAAEIKHLPDLDSHPNVVRFLCVQESQNFTWIALDLFTTSLDQIVEHPEQHVDLVPTAGLDVNDILCQVARGVEHLHSRRVVHRDIKPQNVLVRLLKPGQQPTVGHPNLQVVLSDFGLCKTLDDGPGSAFALTGNHTAAGTTGWKAPELLASGPSTVITLDAGSSGASNPTSTSSELDGLPGQRLRRPGKSIDVFSMGCLFFYVMTQGGHPFDHGGSYARDFNIKESKSNTHDLLAFHSYTYEADDLILQMISHEPQNRPSATQVLLHPYFWPTERKLQFLCDVSDCYEREKVAQLDKAQNKSSSSHELDALEAKREFVWSGDFLKRLPPRIITEAGKQRKYTGTRMIDLLRLIRNKKNHFHDLPDEIKFGEMDGTQEGYYRFWSMRFPSLMVNIHCLIIERELKDNPEFMELRKYFD